MKRIAIGVTFLLFLTCDPTGFSYAQSAQEIKNQLVKKGFSEEVIKLLTPKCQESLNKSVPDGVVWYGAFDRDAKSVTVDFQTKDRAHHSVSVFSLKDGGCTRVQNTLMMTIGPCKAEAERWIEFYKKLGIKIKKEEENEQHIYLGTEGKLGQNVYLYPMSNLCMQVYRSVETVK